MGAGTGESAKTSNAVVEDPSPSRLQLDSVIRVRREVANLYREAKKGERDVAEASKLGHLLMLIARLLEGGEMEERLVVVEKKLGLAPR